MDCGLSSLQKRQFFFLNAPIRFQFSSVNQDTSVKSSHKVVVLNSISIFFVRTLRSHCGCALSILLISMSDGRLLYDSCRLYEDLFNFFLHRLTINSSSHCQCQLVFHKKKYNTIYNQLLLNASHSCKSISIFIFLHLAFAVGFMCFPFFENYFSHLLFQSQYLFIYFLPSTFSYKTLLSFKFYNLFDHYEIAYKFLEFAVYNYNQ